MMLWLAVLFLLLAPVESKLERINRCEDLRTRNTIVLFTEPTKDGQLRAIMYELADTFRAMNYEPIVSYVTCDIPIKLTPAFIQFDARGDIRRMLIPEYAPPEINNELRILGYFAESMQGSRVNTAVGVDLSGRSTLISLHDLDKEQEYILAVLPKRGYSEHLAKYVAWVQDQEYGVFEFQYTQEHLDERTTAFLGSAGHLQSRFFSETVDKPVFYHLHRYHRKVTNRKFTSLLELGAKMQCMTLCRNNLCRLRANNPYHCTATMPVACAHDSDCS